MPGFYRTTDPKGILFYRTVDPKGILTGLEGAHAPVNVLEDLPIMVEIKEFPCICTSLV